MIKYKNNINVGTGSVGYEADATSATPLDSVNEGRIVKSEGRTVKWNQLGYTRDSDLSWSGLADIYHIYTNAKKHLYLESKYIKGNFNFGAYTSSIDDYIKNTLTTHRFYGSVEVAVFGNPARDTLVYLGALHGTKMKTLPSLGNRESFDKTETEIFKKISFVSTVDCDPQYYYMGIGAVTGTSSRNQVGLECKNFKIIDLTSIFGAGNEPSTVEAFEEWLSENMVEQDYYAYDVGSLVPVTVKGVKRDVGGTTVTNPMPVTTLKDENDVVMFPDGLKSAGSVKDEIDWEHGVAVKRVGVVDLGDCTWTYDSRGTYPVFYAYITDLSSKGSKLICQKYIAEYNAGWSGFINSDQNGKIGAPITNNPYVVIQDSAYTSAADFKAAMQGVLLYYELATPITYHFATHTQLKKRVVKIGESVEVDGIEGETVKWNQLMPSHDGINLNGGTYSNGEYISNEIAQGGNYYSLACSLKTDYKTPLRGGDKIFLKFAIKVSDSQITKFALHFFGGSRTEDLTIVRYGDLSTSYKTYSLIITANPSVYEFYSFQIRWAGFGDAPVAFRYYLKEDVEVINLTDIFGSGNEPATVEAFDSWLSAHGGISDYYPYCAGELKDKEEGNVRGVGFNLWDGEYTDNKYINASGGLVTASDYRVTSYIHVLPNTQYYLKDIVYRIASAPAICWYDENKTFISGVSSAGKINNKVVTSPANAAYLRCSIYKETADVACINLSDPSRNGTYEPYKSITSSVDLTTLKGKVDGAGEDVVMFPDGMKQAGSVKDEIFVDGGVVKAVKRVGSVDLGELTWEYGPNYATPIFLSDIATIGAAASSANMLCAMYKPQGGYWQFAGNDKCVATGNSKLNISNSAYTSASDFTTAMQGVMLNYELASPVTYVVNMQGMEMADVRKVMVGTQKVWEKS